MASCNDCIHNEVCRALCKSEEELMPCVVFKDRSRFVELSHAEWIEDEDMYGEPIFRCSNCNERFVLEEGTPLDNCYFYCPNCGAKMDEQDMKERESNG